MGAFTWLRRALAGPAAVVAEQAEAQSSVPLALPAEVNLRGTALTLRLMRSGDGPALLEFARSLPPHDLLFLRRDITQPEQIDAWLEDVSAGLATTILACEGAAIVGYATVASDGITWTRHVRELRVMVHASMRGKQLGRLLTEQAFALASKQGAKKMIAQMTADQEAAIRVFSRMGFEREARLRAQVIDREDQLHDLQIMSLDVDAFQSKLDMALVTAQNPFFTT